MTLKGNEDIRWAQRFSNYKLALLQLKEAVDLKRERELSNLESQGLIQSFEYTHELAWNTMKDFLQHQGDFDVKGSRDAIRGAFKAELITDGDLWMQTIRARNLTSHAYDKKMMEDAIQVIVKDYYPLFIAFESTMDKLCKA